MYTQYTLTYFRFYTYNKDMSMVCFLRVFSYVFVDDIWSYTYNYSNHSYTSIHQSGLRSEPSIASLLETSYSTHHTQIEITLQDERDR
mgnify:FL=1